MIIFGLLATHLQIVGHRVDVVIAIGFNVRVIVQHVVGSIAQQAVLCPWSTRVPVRIRMALEIVVGRAHSLALGHGGHGQRETDHSLVQTETLAGLDGAI